MLWRSRGLGDALDIDRPAGGIVYFNNCALEKDTVFSHTETLGGIGEEAFDNGLNLPPQDTLVGPVNPASLK